MTLSCSFVSLCDIGNFRAAGDWGWLEFEAYGRVGDDSSGAIFSAASSRAERHYFPSGAMNL